MTVQTNTKSSKRPLALALGLWLGMLFLYIAAGAMSEIYGLDPILQAVIANVGVLLLAVGATARLGWWQETGLTAPLQRFSWMLLLLPMVTAAQPLFFSFHLPPMATVGGLALLAFLVGLTEELFFRGVILRSLEGLGAGRAVVLSTVLFAVPHLLNALSGREWGASVIQVGYAFAIGGLFAALRLRVRSLWPVVLMHGLNNFLVWVSEGGIGGGEGTLSTLRLAITAVLASAMLVQTWWMLRRV